MGLSGDGRRLHRGSVTEFCNGIHGAYRRPELAAAIGRKKLREAVQSGRLTAMHRQVVVECERISDLKTRAAAGLLYAGGDTVLTRHTAAQLYGCSVADPSPIDLLVPNSRRVCRRAGLAVHNGDFAAEDVTEIDGLRVLVPELVLAELLCTAYRPTALAYADQMLRALPAARRAGFRADVQRRILDRVNPRGRKRALELLDLATGRPESPFHSRLLLMFHDNGLPPVTPGHAIDSKPGRLDFAWPEFRVAVEYDGCPAPDRIRAECLTALGWTVFRATAADLVAPSRLVGEIRSALRAAESAGDAPAGPGAEVVDVVVGGAGGLGGVGDHAEVAGRGEAALVGVEDVEPGDDGALQGLGPEPDLLVEAERALPAVQAGLVPGADVVEDDEDLRVGLLDDGRQRALPAEVLAAERQAPTGEPPGPRHRGVRGSLHHLVRVHVGAVRGVERHARQPSDRSDQGSGRRALGA